MLMANDSNNCDLTHFNLLAAAFGVKFTNISRNMVKNDTYPQGLVMSGDNEVFSGNYKMFLKELSILEVKSPATPLVSKDGEVIMAVARYGKGKVFVVGDPWLYNEYVDGRKLPAEYNNHLAADQLAKWLLTQ
jgi:unsaturated rhamnogalacturonyl hydrolase